MSDPMRVLHVLASLDDRQGGLQSAVVGIANTQARAGLLVTLAAGRDDGDEFDGLKGLDPRISVELFPYSTATRRFAGSRLLRRWLTSHIDSFDAVHVHAIWAIPSYGTAVLAIRRRTGLIVSPHGSLEPFDLRKHARAKRVLGRIFVRPMLARASVVLCTTERESRSLTTYGATVRSRVIALPPGDLDTPVRGRAEVRRDYGIPEDARVILFVGRLDPKKGLPFLLEAMTHVPDAFLLVVGDGAVGYRSSLQADVDRLGIGQRVRFTGWLGSQAKAEALAASDLFALLSYNENYGIAAVEAAQAGLPSLLTTEVYVAPEMARWGAAVITSQNPREVAQHAVQLFADPERMTAMSTAGLSYAQEVLGEDHLKSEYARLVRDVAGSRRVTTDGP